jgi:hypothetical protein
VTPDEHRRLGVALYNETADMMQRTEPRTADEDEAMLRTAYASAYHWSQVGAGPEHAARSEWQISRVYCVLGRPEPARHHAQRVLDICQRHGIGDWDLAVAYEALARAAALDGDTAAARRYLEQAHHAAAEIVEDEDRDVVLADLATVPLPG